MRYELKLWKDWNQRQRIVLIDSTTREIPWEKRFLHIVHEINPDFWKNGLSLETKHIIYQNVRNFMQISNFDVSKTKNVAVYPILSSPSRWMLKNRYFWYILAPYYFRMQNRLFSLFHDENSPKRPLISFETINMYSEVFFLIFCSLPQGFLYVFNYFF